MLHVLACVTDEHDLRLVALAAVLCAFASWTSVSLAWRARLNGGAKRFWWTLTAGTVFGAGVWSTHFVAMLAYHSAFLLGYDVTLTAASILAAVAFSTVGFFIILLGRPALGGATVGAAISAMHYIGMFAVVGAFDLHWDAGYVVASIGSPLLLGAASAKAATEIRDVRGRILSAVLLTLAICAMHFTAMSALTLIPDPKVAYDNVVLAPAALALAIAAVAILIVSLGLVGAILDKHLTWRRETEMERLRVHVSELEATKAQLEETTDDLRRALAEASAANVAKSAFLAAMSHELRTPLNAIIGFSEVLLTRGLRTDAARRREYLGNINQSGNHLLTLLNDILDVTRLEAGDVDLQENTVSIASLLERTRVDLAGAADAAGLTIRTDVASNLPAIWGDDQMLRRAILNLLSNAIKFTPAGGNILLSARLERDDLHISVADTGIGMAAKDIPRALERFGQVDNRLARKYEGAGLGLPLAQLLVGLHEGTLSIDSVLGSGTTVHIRLPASRIVAEPSPTMSSEKRVA